MVVTAWQQFQIQIPRKIKSHGLWLSEAFDGGIAVVDFLVAFEFGRAAFSHVSQFVEVFRIEIRSPVLEFSGLSTF